MSNESIKHNVNIEDIDSDEVIDIDSCLVEKMDSRTKQHTKLGNLPKLPTGITSSSPVSGEKSARSQKK